jgi:uncharacterized membrane protein YvbJ
MVTWTKCGAEKKEDAKFCSSYGVAVRKISKKRSCEHSTLSAEKEIKHRRTSGS